MTACYAIFMGLAASFCGLFTAVRYFWSKTKTDTTAPIVALLFFIVAALWYIDEEVILTRISMDAFRVQEAQNACVRDTGDGGGE